MRLKGDNHKQKCDGRYVMRVLEAMEDFVIVTIKAHFVVARAAGEEYTHDDP